MELLLLFASSNFFIITTVPLPFLMVSEFVFTKIISYTNVSNLGENLARQYFIFKLMLMITDNHQFKVVPRQFFCKWFVIDNYNKLLGVKPMGLSSPRFDSIDIIALSALKYWIVINPMSLSAPWADSLDIISLNPV